MTERIVKGWRWELKVPFGAYVNPLDLMIYPGCRTR